MVLLFAVAVVVAVVAVFLIDDLNWVGRRWYWQSGKPTAGNRQRWRYG